MSDEAYLADLRPILQDMADRIARIEQFLASSGFQALGGSFDSVPQSFGPPQPIGGPQPGMVPDDILLMARSGKKIQAISAYRTRTGVSLKQAKDIIDQVAQGY